MVKVKILVATEKQIQKALDLDLIDELRAALKVVHTLIQDAKRQELAPVDPGVSYQDLLRWFNRALAPCLLAVPRNPSAGYVIKQVAKAREIGLDEQQVEEIGRGVQKLYPRARSFQLEFLLSRGTSLLLAGPRGVETNTTEEIYTGRDLFIYTEKK